MICVHTPGARTASPLKDADRNPAPPKTRERLRKFEAARRLGRESRENCQLAREMSAAAFALSRDHVLMRGVAARVTHKVTVPDRLPEDLKESCHEGVGSGRGHPGASGAAVLVDQ
jgi:hypothetical protein